MPDESNQPKAYPRKVQDCTLRFVEDTVGEARRLHGLVVALKSSKALLEEQVIALQAEVEREKEERERLQAEMGRTEEKDQRFTEQFALIEQMNTKLANLYVASYQLHGTLDRAVVLDNIRQIVANLVGSEEMGVFEVDREKGTLALIDSSGITDSDFAPFPVGQGLIGRVAETGETWIVGEGSSDGALSREESLTACIPLRLEDRILGVISIFRLLPQKSGVEALDRELFDLLALHAGMALYCTSLHARLG